MNAGRDRGAGFAIWVVLVFIWRPAQSFPSDGPEGLCSPLHLQLGFQPR